MAKLGPEELQRRLKKALKIGGGTHTPADIAALIEEGKMQAWVNGDSLVVTEIANYPQVSAVNIVIAVGSLSEVMAMQPLIEEFGRLHGCAVMRMQGRRGWERVLPHHGWKANPTVVFERTLH
jgi:hypothetical protein